MRNFANDLRSGAGKSAQGTALGPIRNYEDRLDADSRWALNEGSRFFDEKSAVHETMRNITRRFDELGVPYAVVGGMALFAHGYRRFTDDVDILVTRSALREIHEQLDGRGYLPPFTGSKNLRDTEHGVKIEFLVSGEFPGDGRPKPISFPEPGSQCFERDGIKYVGLATLIELKIASGMTSAERIRDLADVQELVKTLNLPAGFAEQLNPYAREKYQELWMTAQLRQKRYLRIWRNKFLTLNAGTLDDMIGQLTAAVKELAAMRADGVVLDPQGGTADDYAFLVTTDPEIARKYDMHDESEFLDQSDDE